VNTTRGYTDDVQAFEFYLTGYGLMKKRTYVTGTVGEHPVLFPTILRQGPSTQFRTPIDDKHTWHIHVNFRPTGDGSEPGDAFNPPVEYLAPYKEPAELSHPFAKYDNRGVIAQDHMAWETQGAIANRTNEHLSYSDRGVVLLRRLVKGQVDRVQAAEDPMGVIRDPNHPIIDTNIDEDAWRAEYQRAQAASGQTWAPPSDAR